MARENINDLLAFVAVAREGSFTKAAAQLGVSQSALSHTIRSLETRLGVRLLTRTTRSVSPTEAGDYLLQRVGSSFDEIEAGLAAVSHFRDSPRGTIRITAAEHATNSVIWPKLSKVMANYPDIVVEVNIDYGMGDIVAQRYDIGIRLGDQVAKDMIAVRISDDLKMAIVGTPAYFAKIAPPKAPQDLSGHNCVTLRLPTHGGLMAWELEKDGHSVKVRVGGQWVFNSSSQVLRAALLDYGLAYVPEDMALDHIADGRLVRVLEDWCQPFPGYHLYYPNRRGASPALGVVIDALRHRV
ncbi:LysR family transcriptional regulator [Achromobacter piechaudii]|uniref:HTH-type transcriptional regulator PgrR n=1 Tax=Achromobacter piechaudii TaxID=72556 RepID=A0A6S7DV14_9BURK|nr:LysR family transcriptional regulator [Achromobacter piechaudii]CAB3868532.1 HTH-type transcriptional regulator PgrR [Achromobacter piechaudii]